MTKTAIYAEGDTIYVGLIEHKHGVNTYAGGQEAVLDAIEKYCLENWEPEGVPGEPDSDIVSRYFQHMEGQESYTIDETEVLL